MWKDERYTIDIEGKKILVDDDEDFLLGDAEVEEIRESLKLGSEFGTLSDGLKWEVVGNSESGI